MDDYEAKVDAMIDRIEIIDALYRFGAGQDLHDIDLFTSAFAVDAQLDFTQPAKRLGVDLPVFRGRAEIVDSIMTTVGRLATTHTVTNPRVAVRGDEAELFALVDAYHVPSGDSDRHLQLKNI